MALNEERSSFLAESNIRNFARNAKNQVIYCKLEFLASTPPAFHSCSLCKRRRRRGREKYIAPPSLLLSQCVPAAGRFIYTKALSFNKCPVSL